MRSLKSIRDGLNRIEILPKAVLSFSTRNRETGEESGEKSVKLSFSITLWHLILVALVAVSVINTLSALRVAFIKRDAQRELLKKMEEKEAAGTDANAGEKG